MTAVTVVLASASPARLRTLRNAGIDPVVLVSAVDESQVTEDDPATLASTLAQLKCRDVATRLGSGAADRRTLVLGCDSVLEVDGSPYGKPGSAPVAVERLARLSGGSAVLHTGHAVVDLGSGDERLATAATTVVFATFRAEEIEAYVATGEPLQVAGAFTIDGLGGAFVERVEGDPHNVVGLSLPLLRLMVAELGISWHELWTRT